MQGENAVASIVSAIKLANEWGKCDTLILGRGGGSMEDLQAFNDEKVARAVFASENPVISAVGHETDFTIVDFVADLRAPTPSAAAELAVNNREFDNERIDNIIESLNSNINSRILYEKNRLENLMERRFFKRPMDNITDNEIYISNLEKQMNNIIKSKLTEKNIVFERLLSKMELLSPFAMLKKGYTIIENNRGKNIKTIDDIDLYDNIKILFKDGEVKAEVKDIVKREW